MEEEESCQEVDKQELRVVSAGRMEKMGVKG